MSRKTFKATVLGFSVAIGAVACAPEEAAAESPHGWVNTNPVYQFSYLNPAGRRVLFSFSDATHVATGRTGIVITTHRIRRDGYHVGIDIKAIPADELLEFSPEAYSSYHRVYTRGWFSEAFDWVKDPVDAVKDLVDKVIDLVEDLGDLADSIEALVIAVLKLADELTALFADEASEDNPDAVVRYASNVRHASGMNASLAAKVGWTFHATMAQEPTRRARRELVRDLVQTIKEL